MCTRIVSDIHFAKMQIRRYWLWRNIQFLQEDRWALFSLLNIRSLHFYPDLSRTSSTNGLFDTHRFSFIKFSLIRNRRKPLSRTLDFHDCVLYLLAFFFALFLHSSRLYEKPIYRYWIFAVYVSIRYVCSHAVKIKYEIKQIFFPAVCFNK